MDNIEAQIENTMCPSDDYVIFDSLLKKIKNIQQMCWGAMYCSREGKPLYEFSENMVFMMDELSEELIDELNEMRKHTKTEGN